MSGIAGIYNLDGRPVDAVDVRVMGGVLAHRGPDGAGTWTSGPVGLGHRLLRATADAVVLPLVHRSGQFAITAEVRLDNREELGNVLGLRVTEDTPSDAELVLESYLRWGEACLDHLLGDFAFAIWDGRDNSLFCARDHMGVRPLIYYHKPGKLFAFGSEPKAVLAAPGVPLEVNESRIADYIMLAIHNVQDTFFKDVLRLPPGHCIRVGPAGLTVRRYWAPDPSRALPPRDDQEYVEGFLELFTTAVRSRTRRVGPMASQLSGGLDSSFVTCVTDRVLSEQEPSGVLHTISCIFDAHPEVDERKYIMPVLERCRLTTPHWVHADRMGPLADLEEALWHEDGPSYTHNGFTIAEMARVAAGLGARVLLDGLDGDTIVSHGFERMYQLAFQGDWRTFQHEATAFEQRGGFRPLLIFHAYGGPVLADLAKRRRWARWLRVAAGAYREMRPSLKQMVMEYGLRPGAPTSLRKLRQRVRRTGGAGERQLIDPAFARRVRWQGKTEIYPVREDPREVHYITMTSGAHATALEGVDRLAARSGVELRHPFFDKRLVEYCLALPPEMKLRDGWGRWVMRQAMEGIVPPEVQWRPDKSRLSPNFIASLWRFEQERLSALRNAQCLDGYVDRSRLLAALDRFTVKQRTRVDADEMLWPALNLAAWLPTLPAAYTSRFRELRRREEAVSIAG